MRPPKDYYNSFKELSHHSPRLQDLFGELHNYAAPIWGAATPDIQGPQWADASLSSPLTGDRFEITICGRAVQFALSIGLEDLQPKASVSCSVADPSQPGGRKEVAQFKFGKSGETNMSHPSSGGQPGGALNVDDVIDVAIIMGHCLSSAHQLPA